MIEFNKFSLTVYRRKADKAYPEGEGMVVINASEPTVGDTDPEKYASETGLKYLSFYMTQEEWEGVADGRASGATDCSHNLRAMGDLWTFFDLEFSSRDRGVSRVPYVNMSFPYHVRRILRRTVRLALAGCEAGGERVTIEIPLALRQRWDRQYGRGKGQVEIWADERTRAALSLAEKQGGETFHRSLSNIKAIAANTTQRHTEQARVAISAQSDGFYWCVYTPKGTFIMNGGLINHGSDEGKPSWSVHT